MALRLFITACVVVAIHAGPAAQVDVIQITGRVVARLDGSALEDVTVTLASLTSPAKLVSTTDSAGIFSFGVLGNGAYTLTAAKPGFVRAVYQGSVGGGLVGAGSAKVLGETPLVLELEAGAVVSGVARDSNGTPVPQARIELLRVSDFLPTTFSKLPWPFVASTDDRGRYRLFGIPPARYLVVATPPQSELATVGDGMRRSRTYYPAAASISAAQTVTLLPGKELNAVDIGMGLAPSFALSGTVRYAGRPMPSALVSLVIQTETGADVRRTRTNSRGDFVFASLAPGTYHLLAEDEMLGKSPDHRLFARRTLDFQGSPGFVELNLERAATLGVRVLSDRTVEGLARPSVIVTLREDSVGSAFGVDRQFNVDAGADSVLSGLAPGKYWVDVTVPRSGKGDLWSVKSVTQGQSDHEQEVVDIGIGSPPDLLIVTITQNVPTLAGFLTDGQGRPAQGLMLIAVSGNADLGTRQAWKVLTPDGTGKFAERGLRAGSYCLAALPTDLDLELLADSRLDKELRRICQNVEVRWGETTNFGFRLAP